MIRPLVVEVAESEDYASVVAGGGVALLVVEALVVMVVLVVEMIDDVKDDGDRQSLRNSLLPYGEVHWLSDAH